MSSPFKALSGLLLLYFISILTNNLLILTLSINPSDKDWEAFIPFEDMDCKLHFNEGPDVHPGTKLEVFSSFQQFGIN